MSRHPFLNHGSLHSHSLHHGTLSWALPFIFAHHVCSRVPSSPVWLHSYYLKIPSFSWRSTLRIMLFYHTLHTLPIISICTAPTLHFPCSCHTRVSKGLSVPHVVLLASPLKPCVLTKFHFLIFLIHFPITFSSLIQHSCQVLTLLHHPPAWSMVAPPLLCSTFTFKHLLHTSA